VSEEKEAGRQAGRQAGRKADSFNSKFAVVFVGPHVFGQTIFQDMSRHAAS
jgi:hypothetical protein